MAAPGGRGGRGGRGRGREEERSPYEEKVVAINRVAKVVKGGRRFSFTALVVVGDQKGKVGVGYGKAKEVPAAIQKGVEEAKKNFFTVPMIQSTLVHEVTARHGAGWVVLKPAAPGTGVIAGGPMRAVLEAAGVRDVLAKSLGTANPINVVYATAAALQSLRDPLDVARLRGIELEELLPTKMRANMKATTRDG